MNSDIYRPDLNICRHFPFKMRIKRIIECFFHALETRLSAGAGECFRMAPKRPLPFRYGNQTFSAVIQSLNSVEIGVKVLI
jgi:hypothetical protein